MSWKMFSIAFLGLGVFGCSATSTSSLKPAPRNQNSGANEDTSGYSQSGWKNDSANREGNSTSTANREGNSTNTANREGNSTNTANREGNSTNTANREGNSTNMTAAPNLLAPGAKGSVTTKIDSNNNTVLSVKAEHLPPPANLDSALSTYVVWLRPQAGTDLINAGQLVMGTDRSGHLDTTTPHTNFNVMITAETNGTVRQPSKFVVLEGQGSRP